MNPLLDKNFLLLLDKENLREVYVKIDLLNFNEEPVQSIEGKVSQGSINIDGASAVRRTCSLTLIPEDIDIDSISWGLATKFKLFVGLLNTLNNKYDDIIWFPQGIYLITDFKITTNTSNKSVYISGKDKMCLLNGDIGGNFPHATNISVIKDGDTKVDLTVKQMITEMIHKYGNELWHNIIIKDVDEEGLELLDFKGESDMYLFKNVKTGIYDSVVFDGDIVRYTRSNLAVKINDAENIIYYSLASEAKNVAATLVKATNKPTDHTYYYIVKCEYGELAGYRTTELTWPSEGSGDDYGLIAAVGDTITSVLDLIVNKFGDYEYFYDINGKFVFLKKLTYVNLSWNSLIKNEDEQIYAESSKAVSLYSYCFTSGNLITAFNNVPNYANVKNDFAIWGKKEGATTDSKDNCIHLRYAIDEKPETYVNYEGRTFTTKDHLDFEKTPNPDFGVSEDWWDVKEWAEYYKENTGEYPPGTIGRYCTNGGDYIDLESIFGVPTTEDLQTTYSGYDSYFQTVSTYNGHHLDWTSTPIYIFDVTADGKLGYTGHGVGCSHLYEYFYNIYENGGRAYIYYPKIPDTVSTGINKDWREIIYQMGIDYLAHNHDDDFEITIAKNNPNYPTGKTGYELYYEDLVGFWRLLYDPDTTDSDSYYIGTLSDEMEQYRYWNKLVLQEPQSLLFWFDFLDCSGGELSNFSVPAIGDRTKAVNDDDIKVIIYKETPDIIYTTRENYNYLLENEKINDGYTYVFLPETLLEYFEMSVLKKTAWSLLENLLYENTYLKDSITLTTVPIYYLLPNTIINVYDEVSKINGDYIIDKITLPLLYNGTMSITATRVPQRIY